MLLHQLRQENPAFQGINELVGFCSKIAIKILYKRNFNEFPGSMNSYFQTGDIAADSIAPLFIKDKSGELPIRKALLSWDKEIKDEASAYYFLVKLISNRIEQETAKSLKEADPFFGKILRSINHLAETNRINKATWFGTVYILERENRQITSKPIDPEFIENLPLYLFNTKNEIIVKNVFEHIKSETDFFPAIPLNALIRKIKSVNGCFLQQISAESHSENYEGKFSVEIIVNEGLSAVNDRLDSFYFGKGKINSTETSVFKNVLMEISNDLKDGGISRGLYEYVKPHMADLSREDYYKRYQQTLDYLVRLLKKEIAVRLDKTDI
ncbi:MAG: hypothetical protein CVV24_11580 [Ignavibacteriae bacterium HGW-Ignavibacteriae-3]|nr:MAG: hypothetical protein CVV24_11580 [Ignavibacteriae bacterium HGW-Ignavibacteriae-3]